MNTTNTASVILLFALCLMGNAFAADDHAHNHEAEAQHETHHQDDDHDEHDNHEHDDDEDDHGHQKNGHGHDHEEDQHDHDHHDEENLSRINDTLATEVGIVTSKVAPQTLHQTITVFGELAAGPEQVSHVRARFSGLIKTVQATIGDQVQAGAILAEVESNESLKTYAVRAPISGLIIQRHANTGEVTQDQVLFSVANFDRLWAELRVYPQQQNRVHPSQPVQILVNDQVLEGLITHRIPELEKPYQLARVELNNESQSLSPGLLVEGRIVTNAFDVPHAVHKDAVQNLGGRQGVFVKQGDAYKFTPLVLGRSDDRFHEVISGLESGAEYVTANSYLIKADIEKSAAEHVH